MKAAICNKCGVALILSINITPHRLKNSEYVCNSCRKTIMRTYRKNNKKYVQNYKHNYNKANPNKVKQWQQNAYNKHKMEYNKDRRQYRMDHPDEVHKKDKEFREKNALSIKLHKRNATLKAKYGDDTIEWIDKQLLLQDNRCAICRMPLNKICDDAIHIDHDHNTLQKRGILCRKCNTGLGMFLDNANLLQKAATYILDHENKVVILND